MRIVVLENKDDGDKIYREMYPNNNTDDISSLIIVDKLIAFIEGCSHEEYIYNSPLLKKEYTMEELEKLNLKVLMLHQIGHFLDNYYHISEVNGYIKIYIDEAKKFYALQSAYLGIKGDEKKNTSPIEYFASAFASYVLYLKYLSRFCPNTYYFINEYVKSLIKENEKKVK